jgi:NTP pyrophosphatase (non-canonical NTP hydrolase)
MPFQLEDKKMSTSGVFNELARQCQKDSQRWFPDTANDLVFMALALGNEAGEVQGVVKKVARGSLTLKDAKTKNELVMEMADVLTYLLQMAAMLGIDLEQAYNMKRVVNEQRFGAPAQNGKKA